MYTLRLRPWLRCATPRRLRRDPPTKKPEAAAKFWRNEVKLNEVGHTNLMHFVYVLEAIDEQHWYIGITDNVDRRLEEHNAGKSPYTSTIKQWRLKTYIAFKDRKRAEAFERYLKSHSGRAFTKKHL